MGCSFSDQHFHPGILIYPNETPLAALERFLTHRNDFAYHRIFSPIIENYGRNPTALVDILISILKLEECAYPLPLRRTLLQFLSQLLALPADNFYFNRFFNDLIVQPDSSVRGRIERLRVLLLERNEETIEGEHLLKRLNYTSLLFEKVNLGLQMKYTIVLDKSGSLLGHEHGKSRWQDAHEAIEHLTEAVERLSTGGMNLYLFSSKAAKHPAYFGIQTCEEVKKIFSQIKPGGSTDLAGCLHQVFDDHFTHNAGRPEHVLVITDGEPDSEQHVIHTLVSGINRLGSENELNITFLQVGCCERAAAFLHKLQDCLTEAGARFNVIDCLTFRDYDGLRLCDVITRNVIIRHQ